MDQSTALASGNMRVAVVILNWRAADMTVAAVRHALAQQRMPDHIYVVDNGSGDGSADVLRDALSRYGHRVTLLVNEQNLGFGGGCNTALRTILADGTFQHVWLLNNDAQPDPCCLGALIEAAAAMPIPGAVGSLMIDPAAGQDHFGTWLHPVKLTTHPVRDAIDLHGHRYAWLTAASLLIAVTALQHVGLFDERYFMYWEDADLNQRLKDAGFALQVAEGARVVHEAGSSSHDIPVRRYVWHRASQRRWTRSHHAAPRAMAVVVDMKYLLKAMLDRDITRLVALLRN